MLKKFIDFRGNRNEDLWSDLLEAYFTIRDDPMILKQALDYVDILFQMVNKMLPALIMCEVRSA